MHTQVGLPHDLWHNKTLDEDERTARAKWHAEVWERASADRRSFEVAAYGVELVASEDSREAVERLRTFLRDAAYSGPPWKTGSAERGYYTTAGLNPVDIESKAIEEVGPFVRRAARELWKRAVPGEESTRTSPSSDGGCTTGRLGTGGVGLTP